jgi:hypothetical protein
MTWYADGMVRRQIDFDEETDRILAELARDYEGDVGKALAELVHAHESLETFVEKSEEVHRASLLNWSAPSAASVQEVSQPGKKSNAVTACDRSVRGGPCGSL